MPCPLCSAANEVVIGRLDRHSQPLATVLCTKCGLAHTDPLPTREQLDRFYRIDYRQEYKGQLEPRPYHVLRAGRLAVERQQWIGEAMPPGSPVLDCGSGGGEFLFLARAKGCDPTGIEPNNGYAEYARRELSLRVLPGMLEDHNFPARPFALVTMFHVLEHVLDPVGYLRCAAAALQPNGHLVVEVPHLDFYGAHPQSRFHRAHLFHFTDASLRATGQRAGLTPVRSGCSAGGENVRVLFRAQESGPVQWPSPAAVAALQQRVQRHSAFAYFASPATLTRWYLRQWRRWQEKRSAAQATSRRAILETLARS
jgi:2-polyprenyl-3-methyl-5-hydroxy-6-metoxy-1,4-benzoquinol methylase